MDEAPMLQVSDLATLEHRISQEIAVSDWIVVSQERINQFAQATGDFQWIHVDVERAARDSPHDTTIAHGFLTLSLISAMARTAMALPLMRMAINYGVNRVRFVSPVPSGSRLRGRFVPSEVTPVTGGIQITWSVTVEREGHEKPACVVEWVVRYYV